MSYSRPVMKHVIGIVGFSGSGKTTLICGLIRELSGVRIAVIKRTHHETPGFSGGKDTDRYLDAGADHSLLVTPRAIHRFSASDHREGELLPIERIVELATAEADLVIIESAMYDGDWPRVLVHAAGRQAPDPLPSRLEAIATDQNEPVSTDHPQFHRDDLETIARFVIRITS